jgi:hypothetical protein
MKTKVFPQKDPSGRDLGDHAFIYCVGCRGHHSLRIRMPEKPTEQELADLKNNVHGLWTFNGDLEKPTFRASLLIGKSWPGHRCHSFITEGKIQYLDDCDHELKGKTISLPELRI